MSENILSKILKPGVRGKIWRTFIIIMIFTFVGGIIDAPSYFNKYASKIGIFNVPEISFSLGLDLQGGAYLTYRADMSMIDEADQSAALEGVRDVIETRVNAFGVSEPSIQTNMSGGEHRIIVELAGITDVNEAIQMIGETPLLEFKEQNLNPQLTEEDLAEIEAFNVLAKEKAEEAISRLAEGEDFGTISGEYTSNEALREAQGLIGDVSSKDEPSIIDIAGDLEVGEYTDIIENDLSFEIYKLNGKAELTNPFDESQTEKEIKASHLLLCYNEIEGCESGLTKDEALSKIKDLKERANPNNFSDLVKENSTEPGADKSGGSLGWFSRGAMVKPFEDTVFPQEVGTISWVVETKFGYHIIYKEDERSYYNYNISAIIIEKKSEAEYIDPNNNWLNTELSGKNLEKALVSFNPNDSSPEVSLRFDSEGADFFANVTERNVGKPVAIFLDGHIISSPTVNEKIPSGEAVISGNFNIQEAKLLTQRLNAGALPVPIELISQTTVGPSLGHISLMESLEAGVLGLSLVALFMILYYRLSGIFAVMSLLVYGIVLLALFKIIPITLSLAGMAGLILSIGMAVDANVLIFERIKEELKKGNPYSIALEEGFRRAWPSIRDGNFSTIITCIILIYFTTSIVKGFAITLMIGVIASMITAIFVTKNFSKLFDVEKLSSKTWLFGVNKK